MSHTSLSGVIKSFRGSANIGQDPWDIRGMSFQSQYHRRFHQNHHLLTTTHADRVHIGSVYFPNRCASQTCGEGVIYVSALLSAYMMLLDMGIHSFIVCYGV